MSTDIERLLADEAADSEENADAPVAAGSTVRRPNRARSTGYSVRLNPKEVAALQALPEAVGLPPSTLVRSWIIERIRAENGGVSDAETELRAAQLHLAHVQRHLSKHPS